MIAFSGVPSSEIEKVWPEVEPLVSRACALGHVDFTPDDVKKDLLSRDSQLWVFGDFDCVCVTRIESRPENKVAILYLVAGDGIEVWKDFEPTFCAWAKEQGCSVGESIGRLGWKLIAKEFGWKPVTMTFRKEL